MPLNAKPAKHHSKSSPSGVETNVAHFAYSMRNKALDAFLAGSYTCGKEGGNNESLIDSSSGLTIKGK